MARMFKVVFALSSFALLVGCSDPAQPDTWEVDAQLDIHPSCWGQASAVFAQMGEMGEHASQEPLPRVGLGNLARALYDAGVIEEPTMAALGAFVASTLSLSIDACS